MNKDYSTLKNFVAKLQEKYPDKQVFTRAELNSIEGPFDAGLMQFAATSKYGGFAGETKITRGMYKIPAAWSKGAAPWDAKEKSAPVEEIKAKVEVKAEVKTVSIAPNKTKALNSAPKSMKAKDN